MLSGVPLGIFGAAEITGSSGCLRHVGDALGPNEGSSKAGILLKIAPSL